METRISPIFSQGQGFADAHRIDKCSSPVPLFTAGSDYPVSDRGNIPNSGFTGCESANAVKRVWRKAKIPSDDIGKQSQATALTATVAVDLARRWRSAIRILPSVDVSIDRIEYSVAGPADDGISKLFK